MSYFCATKVWMEIQEQQEMLVSLGTLAPRASLGLLEYKVHLASLERKVTKEQLEYRGQRDLKVLRASKVFRDLPENKAPVVSQGNVEKKVRHHMIELS